MKKSTRSFLQRPSTTGVLIGVLAIAFSVVGLLLVQTPLEEPQDVRRQASIDNGEVTVSRMVEPANPVVGDEVQVTLLANTAGVPTDGIQVLFNVVTNTFDAMTADVLETSVLQPAGNQVERTADGFLVQGLGLPQTIGQPFTTTEGIPSEFMRITFTPTSAGTVAFNFDREESISILHGSDPLQDKLNHIDPFEITIAEASSDPGASPSPSPSVSPSPSPSPSPDAIGGIQVVGCNVECSSNAECGINQRCYNVDSTNRCRLAVNPTNDRCITADTGPNYSCNQGCADTHECETGLVCWYNQCRDPLNVEDTSCSALSDEETESLASSCNASCQSNNDCDVNLRCYQGACRLVTNPSSSTCSPAIMSTISSTYKTPKGGSQDTADSSDEAMEMPEDDETATTTGQTTGMEDGTSTTDTGAMKVQPVGMTEEEQTTANETALDVLLKMMQTPDSALPLIVIGAGIGLLVIALIVILLRKLTGNSQQTPVTPKAPTTSEKSRPAEPVQARKDLDTPLTTARSMTTPTASMPTRSTLERQLSQVAQTPAQPQASSQGMPPATTQPAASGDSSMLRRMKNKGISVPNTSANSDENRS